MGSDNSPSRRGVLAALGALGSGSSIVTATAAAQERDPDDLDRPRTIRERGLEITMYDCARVMIDGEGSWIDHIQIGLEHLWERPYHGPDDPPDIVISAIDFHEEEITLPLEVNVNTPEYHEEFDVPEGSIIINDVVIFETMDGVPSGPEISDATVSVRWPIDKWDCYDVMRSEPELW